MALNSGTSALHLALLALGIGPGDEVIAPAMTFVATAAAIRYTGATPVLVDADPLTWNIDPAAIEREITPRTRAIIPSTCTAAWPTWTPSWRSPHSMASRSSRTRPRRMARHGRGASAGTMGAIGCFSFYPGKNLGACGEGGGAVTSDPALAARMRKLRDWGQEGRYNHVEHAFNYRMDGIQGAILSVKLKHLPRWTERRREVAALYDRLLAELPVQLPATPKASEHVYHVYALRHPDRDRLATRPRRSRRRHGPALSSPRASAASLCRSRQRPRQLPRGRGPRRRIPLLAHLPRTHPRASSATSPARCATSSPLPR